MNEQMRVKLLNLKEEFSLEINLEIELRGNNESKRASNWNIEKSSKLNF